MPKHHFAIIIMDTPKEISTESAKEVLRQALSMTVKMSVKVLTEKRDELSPEEIEGAEFLNNMTFKVE